MFMYFNSSCHSKVYIVRIHEPKHGHRNQKNDHKCVDGINLPVYEEILCCLVIRIDFGLCRDRIRTQVNKKH